MKNYNDVIAKLKAERKKKIIVCGPQRSGSRFSANTIAKDLGYKFIDELDYDIINFNKMINLTKDEECFCVQAPSLTHLIKDMPNDFTIIFMFRDIDSIRKSEKRISWVCEAGIIEYTKKEFKSDSRINWNAPISVIKYEIWEKIQKPSIANDFYEVDYNTFSHHPAWKKKKDRMNFKASQIE